MTQEPRSPGTAVEDFHAEHPRQRPGQTVSAPLPGQSHGSGGKSRVTILHSLIVPKLNFWTYFLLQPFPYLGLALWVFIPRSPVFSLYSFLLHIFSYNIAPPQFWSSYLSASTIFHFLITTFPLFFYLPTCPNHLSLSSLIFSLICAKPALDLISSFQSSLFS